MPGREIFAFNGTQITDLHDGGHFNHHILEILGIPRSSVVRIEFDTVGNSPRSRNSRVYYVSDYVIIHFTYL